MNFCKSFKNLTLVRLRLTRDFACVNNTTREIIKRGSEAEVKSFFQKYVDMNKK